MADSREVAVASAEETLLPDVQGSSDLPVVAFPAWPPRRRAVASAVSALLATAALAALALAGRGPRDDLGLRQGVGLWQAEGDGLMRFRVAAPPPYRGLHYRRSMNLTDAEHRLARNGATVQGVVEEGGQWLRLERGRFLPMIVGVTPVLQRMFLAENFTALDKTPAAHKNTTTVQKDIFEAALLLTGHHDGQRPKAQTVRNDSRASKTRKGSFLVLGDWGWDPLHHGNVFSNTCQQEIAKAMAEKFDELGDVKFIINVGDSFYPKGVADKSDPQWDDKWRNIYDKKLRSVPWYSVYGNHDYRGDPCACSATTEECAQVNSDETNLDYFYMPAPNWYKHHPELDLEVVAMDLNQYVGSWNYKKFVAPIDCWLTNCLKNCSELINYRAQEAFRMFYTRMNVSRARNMVVFSHYPTDYFAGPEPKFIAALSDNSKHHVEYFGGHRHDVDRASTVSTHPNNNWLVGGGGGWGCDGQKQGFVVGQIDHESRLTTHAVLVDPKKCCPGH